MTVKCSQNNPPKLKIIYFIQGWTRLRTRVWQSGPNEVDSESGGEGSNVIDVVKVEEGEEEEKQEEQEELYRDGYR